MKRFFPVIHIDDIEQAQRQVGIAVDCKADGVWLISHTMNHTLTMAVFEQVRSRDKHLWIGINLLGSTPYAAMNAVTMPESLNGLWCDVAGIDDHGVSQGAKDTWDLKNERGWTGEYFGSVAFKAGPDVKDAPRVARMATPYMDVVTTSGTATGVAAPVEKLRDMKDAIGKFRLAVASGITPDNVREYLPYVDDYFVATGISHDFHHLDPERTRELSEIIHA
jgi:predicted TIM-barrel enzyme